jgi:putative hydrolase of the HAD superfamily
MLGRQQLIIDGDDTLWENNVLFEAAIDESIRLLASDTHTPAEVREILDEIETETSSTHGYGALAFAVSLRRCSERISDTEVSIESARRLSALAKDILDHPVEIIDGVEETLAYLKPRHNLTLLTKGEEHEQRRKVQRSGLKDYFDRVLIVREKRLATFRDLRSTDLGSDGAWMIGNSPKSDINPALAAGINAVYVPHAATWRLEMEELRPGTGMLIVLQRFTELVDHF